MPGQIALVLHAHLPFVRHPEHERFLEESWLFEAITESYLPLLEMLGRWREDRLEARLTVGLSPTLCSMLSDPLLRERYDQRLEALITLAGKETFRTHWQPEVRQLAEHYHDRFVRLRESWIGCGRDLVGAFRQTQETSQIEIITTAATHALLPLVAEHPPSLRAQVFVARDHYRACFGREPGGFWLPECAYAPQVEPVLKAAGFRWFITEAHGLMQAEPAPPHGVFAPVSTRTGLIAFGRDTQSARQVWSRREGYPGDFCYRDFYRDIGYDLDLEYVLPCLPSPGQRGFTGIKYHRITGPGWDKDIYRRDAALARVREHARHFLEARAAQTEGLSNDMDRPPLLVAPYDAELFGHWWYEGIDFLDALLRTNQAQGHPLSFVTLGDCLERHPPTHAAQPRASSWGEEGYWGVWLNDKNEWILRHLRIAQERMGELARMFPQAEGAVARALRQAAREVMLAQASDWPFILHTGTSPDYARQRVRSHLSRFLALYEQITRNSIDEAVLAQIEQQDNLFADLDYSYWAG